MNAMDNQQMNFVQCAIIVLGAISLLQQTRAYGQTTRDSLVVTTANGRVQGVTQMSPTNKEVDAWLGIPFAQKPLDDLRFKPPLPVTSWNGVLNATILPNTCMQIPSYGDTSHETTPGLVTNTPVTEDCLYLSIWAPKPRPTSAAVMIWIYGGAFQMGSSTSELYDPSIIVSETNVIVVGIQYRVGYFGFLHFGTDEVQGNAGLLDQVLAIQWVHDNIQAFGGDSDRITLFGESAGSFSISLLLMSPLGRNTFSQAIMESGIAPTRNDGLSDLNTHEEAVSLGLQWARIAGCDNSTAENLHAVITCLRAAPAQRLIEATRGLPSAMPTVDGTFLVEPPQDTIANGNFKRANILAGTNTGDGAMYLMMFWNVFGFGEDATVNASVYRDAIKAYIYPNETELTLDSITFEYTQSLSLGNGIANRDALSAMVRDQRFSCRADDVGRKQSAAGQNAFMYLFAYHPSLSTFPAWSGGFHTEEIQFVFGHPLNPRWNYTASERELGRAMMTMWTNFAKHGDPSISASNVSTAVNWPRYSVASQSYLLIDDALSVRPGSDLLKCNFWNDYLPQLVADTQGSHGHEASSSTRWISVNRLLLMTWFISLSISLG